MGAPRNNSNSGNANGNRSNTPEAKQKHFVEGVSAMPVQDFLDDYVFAYDGKFKDFRYRDGESTRKGADGKPRMNASFLVVKMPRMRVNPTDKTLELDEKVDKEGNIIPAPMVDVVAFASEEANKRLNAQKGSEEPLKDIQVSVYYDTDPTTGKETGLAGFSLSVSSGESVDAASLGLRI